MTRALLDVNVLLALLDTDHVDHARAQDWVATDELREGWASCAVTENGFVRVMGQPRYPSPVSPVLAAGRLQHARGSGAHEFWPCDVSILDTVNLERVHGPSQLTDAYLLALAVAHDGRLVTLDRRVTLTATHGARPEHLVIV